MNPAIRATASKEHEIMDIYTRAWNIAHKMAAEMKREERPRVYDTVVKSGGGHVTAFVVGNELLVPTDAALQQMPATFTSWDQVQEFAVKLRPLCKICKWSNARLDKEWKAMGAGTLVSMWTNMNSNAPKIPGH
jgi:hypothetical protein